MRLWAENGVKVDPDRNAWIRAVDRLARAEYLEGIPVESSPAATLKIPLRDKADA